MISLEKLDILERFSDSDTQDICSELKKTRAIVKVLCALDMPDDTGQGPIYINAMRILGSEYKSLLMEILSA